MDFVSVFLIAVALAMDALAVSIAYGFDLEYTHPLRMTMIALTFGIFQAVMPVAGWLAGKGMYRWISPYDHWLVFALLSGLGLKMIWDAFKGGGDAEPMKYNVRMLLLLGFATSIDAMAVGVSLALIKVRILFPVLIIGAVTFILSYAGVYVGRVFGRIFRGKANAVGGMVLIFIGVRILLSHLKGS